MTRTSCRSAFSVVELLMMVAVVVVLATVFMRSVPTDRDRGKAGRIKCVNNLKNVGLAFRIFATDNGDRFPGSLVMSNALDLASINVEWVYGLISNELSTPKILSCPVDRDRQGTESFATFSATNVSYFVSLSARESDPHAFLAGDRNMQVNGKLASRLLPLTSNDVVAWTGDIHADQGNIAMGDGSVQQMTSTQLKGSVRGMGGNTNYLVFPQ